MDLELATVVTIPTGVNSVRSGCSVKLTKNFNSYEANFSAEMNLENGLNSGTAQARIDRLEDWVREECYKQLNEILKLSE